MDKMSQTRLENESLFTVVEPMNGHGAVTVRRATTHATHHVVTYADESTRRTLSSLSADDTVRLDLDRVGHRGSTWRAEAATPRPPGTVGDVAASD